jgi:hypothetical protein
MGSYLSIFTNFISKIYQIIKKTIQTKSGVNCYFPKDQKKPLQNWKTIKIISENFKIINDQLAILKPESHLILIHPTVCSFATEVNWPRGIRCFEKLTIESIKIPNSITSLSSLCFYQCSSLKQISLPNSITSLGNHCFSECSSLTQISLPNSITSLGYSCFSFCSSLKTIELPSTLKSIGAYCFHFCKSLKSINFPSSLQYIGYNCFGNKNYPNGIALTKLPKEILNKFHKFQK